MKSFLLECCKILFALIQSEDFAEEIFSVLQICYIDPFVVRDKACNETAMQIFTETFVMTSNCSLNTYRYTLSLFRKGLPSY